MRNHNIVFKLPFLFALNLLVACNTNVSKDNDILVENDINSDVVLKWDTSRYFLNHCTATLENGDVKLFFETRPDSLSEYQLEIWRSGGRFFTELQQTLVPLDCSYVVAQFKILNGNIQLDKKVYKKGDNLKGTVDLLLLGQKAYFRDSGDMTLRQNYDTIPMFGSVKTKVQ